MNVIRLEPRLDISPALAAGAPIIAAGLALALAAIPLALTGIPVLRAYGLAAAGIFGSPAALGDTLARAIPLTLTGLATSLALRIRLYNFGAEGQLFAGALAAIAVGTGVIVAPPFLMIPLVVVAGAAAGAVLMLLAALIKLRRGGDDEVIVTLMLNVVMLFALQMTFTGPLDIATATVRSQPLIEQATLAWLGGVRLAVGFAFALAAIGLVYVVLRFTVWGFDIRAMAGDLVAARSAGIRVARMTLRIALISGALAGMAGAFEVVGTGYATQDIAGLGYAGIAVAVLAGRSPLAVFPAALFVAVLLAGAGPLKEVGASKSLADIAVALTILLALIAGLFTRYRLRWGRPVKTAR
jgi:ABC-type uncharacterized transport system permease subunit